MLILLSSIQYNLLNNCWVNIYWKTEQPASLVVRIFRVQKHCTRMILDLEACNILQLTCFLGSQLDTLMYLRDSNPPIFGLETSHFWQIFPASCFRFKIFSWFLKLFCSFFNKSFQHDSLPFFWCFSTIFTINVIRGILGAVIHWFALTLCKVCIHLWS